MTKQHVSRRAFLAGSAASMALGSLAGVAHAATKPQEQWDEVFDVIVIGSGLAGMCAALAAKKNGCKKVVVLEKMSYLGGNSAIATGDFGAVNSQLTRKQGIKDTPEAFAEDISAACGGLNHPDLTLTVARNSGRAIDFLIENGAKFNPEIIILGGHSAPRVHQGVESFGASVMVPIWDSFRKKYNGEIRSRVKFDSFIRDESGAVTGVNVRERYDFINESKNEDMENAGGLPKRYAARYGVVLATGGYSRDLAFRMAEAPLQSEEMATRCHIGNTAGALRAALAIGARSVHTTLGRYGFYIASEDLRMGMVIDPKTCKRFIDESMPRTDLAVNMLLYMQKHRCIPLGIYDKKTMDAFFDHKRRQRLLFSNALRPYDTLEELAAKEHLDLKTLKATLDRYNKDIAAGRDSEFGKDIAGSLSVPLTEPPFAACTIEPDLSYTQGGVLINTRAEAISALDDKPIPGLYVAGEASAGVFGVTRLTACSLPDCAAFGMISGEEIAKRARNIKA